MKKIISRFFSAITSEVMNSLRNLFGTIASQHEEGILANRHNIGIRITMTDKNVACVKGVIIDYQVEADYDTIYAEIIDKLDAISEQIHDDWSPVEKALFLHDYLAVHYNYTPNHISGSDDYLEYSAYGMLTRGYAVCEGYAWLYSILMNREGIETHVVCSVALGHAWNMVHIGEEWFHVDVTWDDNRQGHAGLVSHTSCLKGHDAMLESGHNMDDWKLVTGKPESELNVSDRYDNAFWDDSTSTVQFYQGKWLVVTPTDSLSCFNLYDYDAETGEAECETLLTSKVFWTSQRIGYYYPGAWFVPAVYEDVIFYTFPNYIMAWYDNQTHSVYKLSDEQKAFGKLYGLYVDGENLIYDVSPSPSGEVQEYSIAISECLPERADATESISETTVESMMTEVETTETNIIDDTETVINIDNETETTETESIAEIETVSEEMTPATVEEIETATSEPITETTMTETTTSTSMVNEETTTTTKFQTEEPRTMEDMSFQNTILF